MDNMMFGYGIERKYRYKLTVDILSSISDGATIAYGHGTYHELEKHPINWIAVKGHGHNDWAVYYHDAKYIHEYARHNGEKIHDKKLIKELLNCDDEVLKTYRR